MSTVYRVLVEGNLCPDVYSNTSLIYVDPVVSPGLMLGGDSLCVTSVAGSVNLLGSIGNISYWQQSTDNGITWTNLPNTSDFWDYTGITETTWYRAFLDGGNCPDGFSDTGIVYVDSLVIPGHVSGTDSLCEMAVFGFLNLSGANGSVSHWESSVNNGASWDVILNSTPNLNYFSVDTTTWYRVYSKALFCTGAYSDTAVIYIDPLTNPGVIDSSMWICAGSSANLTLHDYVASIFQWQSSPDGISWSDVAGATQAVYNPSNLMVHQYYHVITQNGLCPPETTDPILISVYTPPFADAGNDTTILLYDEIPLSGMGGISGVWSPPDGLSNPNSPFTMAKPTETTTYYYTVTDNQGCTAVDSVLITIDRPDHVDVMNVITANGDNSNDNWIIVGVEYFPSTFVAVYNIYGKEVYSNSDYKNDWKGTFHDKRLPNGTYYYTVIPGGTEQKIQGALTILGNE
jgi:gliding motility-associated-like protein